MNPELHHRWNAERNPSRDSDKEGESILKEDTQKNTVKLKQNKPR